MVTSPARLGVRFTGVAPERTERAAEASVAPVLPFPSAPLPEPVTGVDRRGVELAAEAARHAERGDLDAFAAEVSALVERLDASPDRLPDLGAALGALYLTQHQALGLAAAASERDQRTHAREVLRDIGAAQARLFERCVAVKDALEAHPVPALTVFRNTMKRADPSTREERRAYYVQALERFLDRGGSLDQILDVRPDTIADLEGDAYYEWVVTDQDDARMTRADLEPSPGHVIQAEGRDVFGAGSMRVFRDDEGEILAVVLGTFSGHYRSTAAECEHMKRHLVAAGVPEDCIVVQGGAAASPRAVSLAMSDEEGRAGMERLQASAARYHSVAPIREEHAHPAVDTADRARRAARVELLAAAAACDAALQQASASGVILERGVGTASSLAGQLGRTLRLAVLEKDRVTFERYLSEVVRLSELTPPAVDREAQRTFSALYTSWSRVPFASRARGARLVPAESMQDSRTTAMFADVDSVRALDALTADVDGVRLDARTTTPELFTALDARAEARGRPFAVELVTDGVPTAEQLSRSDHVTVRASTLADFTRVLTALREGGYEKGVGVSIATRDAAAAAFELATHSDHLVVDVDALAEAFGPYEAIAAQRRAFATAAEVGIPSVARWTRQDEPRPEQLHDAIVDHVVDAIAAPPSAPDGVADAIHGFEAQRRRTLLDVTEAPAPRRLLDIRADAARAHGRRGRARFQRRAQR